MGFQNQHLGGGLVSFDDIELNIAYFIIIFGVGILEYMLRMSFQGICQKKSEKLIFSTFFAKNLKF